LNCVGNWKSVYHKCELISWPQLCSFNLDIYPCFSTTLCVFYSCVRIPQLRMFESSSFVLFLIIVLAVLDLLHPHMNFGISLSIYEGGKQLGLSWKWFWICREIGEVAPP
jgi:hypothetical protein